MMDGKELASREGQLPAIDPATAALVSAAVREMVAPVMEQVAALLKNNTEAVQCLAAQSKVQSDRLTALEKELRLLAPVTNAQVRYLNAGIKDRCRALLARKNIPETAQTVKKLTGCIRKAVLTRYGISSLRDLPRCEYTVAMTQIETWNDLIAMRDIGRLAEAQNAALPDEKAAGG